MSIVVATAPVDRSHRFVIGNLALSHFGVDLVSAGFFALIPATVERLDQSMSMVGVLVALFSITALGSQPLLGAFADRHGHATTASIAAVAGTLLLAAAVVMPTTVTLIAAVVVGGLAAGAFHPAGAALARTSTTRSPERAVATFAAAGTVGLAVGPIAAISLLAWWGGWSLSLLVLPTAVASVRIWRRRDRSAEAVGDRVDRRQLGRIARDRTTAVATLVALTTTVIVSTIPLWISAQPGRSSHDPAIGIALGVFSLASAVGGLIGSGLTGRIAAGRILHLGLIGASVAASSIFLTTPATGSFYGALVIAGLLTGPTLPILLVAAQDMFPDQRAAASGTVVGLSNGVAGVAILGVAVLLDRVGFRAGAALALVALLTAAAIVRTIPALDLPASRGRDGSELVLTCGCVMRSSAPSVGSFISGPARCHPSIGPGLTRFPAARVTARRHRRTSHSLHD